MPRGHGLWIIITYGGGVFFLTANLFIHEPVSVELYLIAGAIQFVGQLIFELITQKREVYVRFFL